MYICTESDAEQAHFATLLPDTFSPGQDRDCCPITTALPGVVPEHRVNVLSSNHHEAATPIFTVQLGSPTLLNREHSAAPVSNSDPPLERLRTLRI